MIVILLSKRNQITSNLKVIKESNGNNLNKYTIPYVKLL